MTQWILTSSLLILAVFLIRFVGQDKLGARMRYALWALVLLRLLMPFSIGESALSVQNILPKTQTALVQTEPILISDIIETTQMSETIEIPAIPIAEGEASRTSINALVVVWAVGSMITALIFIISNLRFASRLRRSRQKVMHRAVPVYMTEAVETPCLFGLWKPAIYVTPEVWENETALRHALAHELTHYRHKDHIWSVLRCVCVSLHWFNPLVWLAAIISQKDAEMACDEGTLQRLGEHERTDYAKTLVDLTCVGYKGMLTAATSMTGSDSDLKQRVLRIVKNPKMSAIAVVVVLVAAILVSLTVFTAAKAPAIEGVWGMELSYLGAGVNDFASAYMEYEFYEGRGIRTDHMGGEIRSAEWFSYTVDGDTLELQFDGAKDAQIFTFTVTDDILQLNQKGREQTLTRVEQKELPFLPEGVNDIMEIHNVMNEENLQLTDVQSAQLLYLFRSGEITVIQDYMKNGVEIEDYSYTVFTDQCGFCITDGVILGTRNENTDGYVLSNIDEIEYWLETFVWSGNEIQVSGFKPSDLQGIVSARLILYDRAYPADPGQLAFLEELLTTAEPLGYLSGCPFDGLIEVTLSDGRKLGVEPALDSCAAFMIWDTCYEYGNQFATDDEGSYDNSELLAVFGLTPTKLEEIIGSRMQTTEGEVLGTNADIGDVVRIQNDVMEPTYLSDEAREVMNDLLGRGLGDVVGREEIAFDTTYYTILGSELNTEENMVTLSDNGSLYIDGLRYEMTNANALLQLLDAQYAIRIAHDGKVIESDRYGAVGDDLYLELLGVTDEGKVTWSSSNEAVCTVAGDTYGAIVTFNGVGEAQIAAEWKSPWNTKGYTFIVHCE